MLFLNACVARPVNKEEIKQSPAAQKALDTEWAKLVLKQVWDESQGFEWSSIAAQARVKNETVHVGRVFENCTEKGQSFQMETLTTSLREEAYSRAIRYATKIGILPCSRIWDPLRRLWQRSRFSTHMGSLRGIP